MGAQYDGMHGIRFINERDSGRLGVKHTWQDFCLIPAEAPYIAPDEPSLSIVSIPGNGSTRSIDLSEVLRGKVINGRRTGEWQFFMDCDRYCELNPSVPYDQASTTLYDEIRSWLHGQWVKVVFDDDYEYDSETFTHTVDKVYSGRVYIKDFKIDNNYSSITLAYNLGNAGDALISDGQEFKEESSTVNPNQEWVMPMDSSVWTNTEDTPPWGFIIDDYVYTQPENYEIIIPEEESDVLIEAVEMSPDLLNPEDTISSDEIADYGDYLGAVYFCNDDNSVLQQTHTPIGSSVEYTGPAFTSAYDSNATFNGWVSMNGDSLDKIKKFNTYFYASYTYPQGARKVKLSFYNDNNSLVEQRVLDYSEDPEDTPNYYLQATSAIEPNAEHVGLDINLQPLTHNQDYHHVYRYSGYYIVEFYNDGNAASDLLLRVAVKKGGTAVYSRDDTPVSKSEPTAEFIGWDNVLTSVNADMRVKARYRYSNSDAVYFYFLNDDGTILKEMFEYGSIIVAYYQGPKPVSAINKNATFLGWKLARIVYDYSTRPATPLYMFFNEPYENNLINLNSTFDDGGDPISYDMAAVAVYKKIKGTYTVDFRNAITENDDYLVWEARNIPFGGSASVPDYFIKKLLVKDDIPYYQYGWSVPVSSIRSDITTYLRLHHYQIEVYNDDHTNVFTSAVITDPEVSNINSIIGTLRYNWTNLNSTLYPSSSYVGLSFDLEDFITSLDYRRDVAGYDDTSSTLNAKRNTEVMALVKCHAMYSYMTDRETITDSWEEIISSVNDGSYKDRYNIGDTKIINLGEDLITSDHHLEFVEIDGVQKWIPVHGYYLIAEIIGFDQDIIANSDEAAAVTWLIKYTDPLMQMASGSYIDNDTYTSEDIREYLESTFYDNVYTLLPKVLRDNILEVKKNYPININNIIYGNYKITNEKLWLVSEDELGHSYSRQWLWYDDRERVLVNYEYHIGGIELLHRYYHDGTLVDAYLLRPISGSYTRSWIDSDGNRRIKPTGYIEAKRLGLIFGFCI